MSDAPVFPNRRSSARLPQSPEELFGELARARGAIGALWSHQADQLRDYAQHHLETADLAIELPTGSGKTLVGLLIAEWRRRARRERVVYACPTHQLAEQVAATARDQGVSSVLLIGRSADWTPRDQADYTSGSAIAITTYSAIFNTHSRFADANVIVFDDAHAAENYVAGAWAVTIPRERDAYHQLLDAFAPSLDEALLERMAVDSPDSGSRNDVRLMSVSSVDEHLADVRAVLRHGLDRDQGFRLSMISDSLDACLFYLSRGNWYIRPLIAPTFSHHPYTDPRQRVYLSATLGEAGELERAFGRPAIQRMPVPPAWERGGAGRRFIVFPQLADGVADEDDATLLSRIHALAPKALVLTPDHANANVVADHIGVPDSERFRADEQGAVRAFADAERGTLLAASRYDGMDLAGESCRLELMVKAPELSHLQDRFIASKLNAPAALRERIRTRITQGLGRTTRGPRDWSVVVVFGQDLLRYFSNSDNTSAMPLELQAEIEFGLSASRSSADNIVALSRSALAQDQAWRDNAEVTIADMKQELSRVVPPISEQLAFVAPHEIRAWRLAWSHDWAGAAEAAVQVLDGLIDAGTRPYRALWAYLASAWFRRAAQPGDALADRARRLLEEAHQIAGPNTWLRDTEPLSIDNVALSAGDAAAIGTIIERINGPWRSTSRFSNLTQGMLDKLSQFDATPYEQGLVDLGLLVGADSYKPSGQGRCDAAWVFTDLWITIEAKSEQTADRISMSYVRQANSHLDSLATDRSEPSPENSISVIASTTALVDPDAVAIAWERLYLVQHGEVLDIAHQVHRALVQIRASVSSLTAEHATDTVTRILKNAELLPSQLRQRLAATSIRA